MQEQPSSLVVQDDHPLIGVVVQEYGKEVTCYFSDEKAADAAATTNATDSALNVIGAWSDLDWREMKEALDRIRHESPPTPPIDES